MRNHRFTSDLVTVAVVCAFASAAFASPIIEVEKTTCDLGEVLGGSSCKATFSCKSTGDADLEIKEVSASCGCTYIKTSCNKLKPGESATIEMAFDVPAVGGDLEKPVQVLTNDPEKPVVRLKVTGKIVPVISFAPPRINFGTVKAGTKRVETIDIIPGKAEGFVVEKITSSGTRVTVDKLEKSGDGKGSYRATLSISAGDEPGRLFEILTIHTDLPNKPKVTYQVFGNVVNNALPTR